MKVQSILAAGIVMSAIAVGEARADQWCQLAVNPSPFIAPGQWFSYGIDIAEKPDFSPPTPGGLPGPPFTVVFHGTKNGAQDIPNSGEQYPATFNYGHSDLTGYQNASSALSGTYLREATVLDLNGNVYCTTNTIFVVLQ